MFIIKLNRIRANKKSSRIESYGYWNAQHQRFGAKCFATTFSAQGEADLVKDRLTFKYVIPWRSDYITVEILEPDFKLIKSPIDVPQFA